MKSIEVKIVNRSNNPLPEYSTVMSSGMDLRANLIMGDVTVRPMERKLIPTGVYISLPEGYEAQIRPRSGLAFKNGVTVLNSPGTIDADYRGEIGVILVNLSDKDFVVKHGDRIAQMVIAKYEKAEFSEVMELDQTVRGEGGFGHTGVNDAVKDVVDMENELVFVESKCNKLRELINNTFFDRVVPSVHQRSLVREQLSIMLRYRGILMERIEYLRKEEKKV